MNKKKFELEYTFNTSPKVLFTRLSTPSGLAEWFADNVNLEDDIYTFIWDGSEEQAKVIQKKDLSHIRFKWLIDCEEDCYFEFRLQQHELTGDLALIITDFAEDEEKSDTIDLWDSQISDLKRAIGL